jgi:hypothetical protein
MAESNYRPDRTRDPLAHDALYRTTGDPLAELARLIGQADPYAETHGRDSYDAPDDGAGRGRPAEQDYPQSDDGYTRPEHDALGSSHEPHEAAVETSPIGRFFSGTAAQFDGFHEESEIHDRHEPPPLLPPARQLESYAAEPRDDYAGRQIAYGSEDRYAAHDDDDSENYEDGYEQEAASPRRRSGVVMVMAIFSLAVVGTAGAFGYRAMFGGSVLPTLPPIIKASNGPNKIVPAYGDAQANTSGQASAAGSTESLMSREEQPVTVEPPKPAPRVVSTIPIINGQGSLPAGMNAAGTPAGYASAPTNSPWPPAPPAAAAPPSPAPPPAVAQAQPVGEPKRIHTVTIRPDQQGVSEAPPPAAAAARPAPTPRATPPAPKAAANPAPPASNAPLSIVPGGQADAAPAPRARAAAPVAVASAAPGPIAASAPASGGYAVQVTSQRSEAEAQAAFRELKAKYPGQLNGREALIRRADLGAKGTYYRALVGPFASAEEAAGLCSGLKAAGASCIVQRN